MKRIYVAGKLNDNAVNYIKNLHKMTEWTIKLQHLGFAVFNPGLDFLAGFLNGNFNYYDYADNNMEWLKVADAIFVIPYNGESKGTNVEIKEAKNLDIPVFYTLENILKWKDENE